MTARLTESPVTLVWVKAPHYCAGLKVRDSVCFEAAPILRWATGKRWAYLRSYFARKGFEVVTMPAHVG